jgi:excisionase family DNA binding protein
MDEAAKLDKILAYSLLAAKNVFTFEEAALMTGLSKSYLYQLTSKRLIPHYKPKGKQVYFDRAELEKWMKQNKVPTILEDEQKAAVYAVAGAHKRL